MSLYIHSIVVRPYTAEREYGLKQTVEMSKAAKTFVAKWLAKKTSSDIYRDKEKLSTPRSPWGQVLTVYKNEF